MHDFHDAPSPWVIRHAHFIRAGGSVLDLACGRGRNARWLARQGWQVEAVDCDAAALATLAGLASIHTHAADLEQGAWPYAGRRFDGIVVCRYLYRPLLPLLAQALAPGGILIYETFMQGQETLGRPRNPDFLLAPDELVQTYAGLLDTLAFEQGIFAENPPASLQRICAKRPLEQ